MKNAMIGRVGFLQIIFKESRGKASFKWADGENPHDKRI